MDPYRTPDERFEPAGWGFAPRDAEQDGLRMHYVDEGTGDPVLLLRGVAKVALHADLTVLARLSLALARARAIPLAA